MPSGSSLLGQLQHSKVLYNESKIHLPKSTPKLVLPLDSLLHLEVFENGPLVSLGQNISYFLSAQLFQNSKSEFWVLRCTGESLCDVSQLTLAR